MGGACTTYRETRHTYKIILKRDLKYIGWDDVDYIWLRLGTRAGFCVQGNGYFQFRG